MCLVLQLSCIRLSSDIQSLNANKRKALESAQCPGLLADTSFANAMVASVQGICSIPHLLLHVLKQPMDISLASQRLLLRSAVLELRYDVYAVLLRKINMLHRCP